MYVFPSDAKVFLVFPRRRFISNLSEHFFPYRGFNGQTATFGVVSMEYDRSDSFPFDSEPNGIPLGSKSKGKLSPRSYPIQCDRKWKHSFLSV